MSLPLPRLTPESEFFWTSGADGRLRILRCGNCGRWAHPPVPRCRDCAHHEFEAEPVSGLGTVFSVTVNYQPFLPAIPPPYVLAIVELDEQPGLQLTTRIVHCEPDEVSIGMRVSVVFSEHGAIYLPLFEPETRANA